MKKKRTLKLLSIIMILALLVVMFGGCAKKVEDTDNDSGYDWEDAQYRSELASEFGPNTRPYYDEVAGEFDVDGYFASRGWGLDDSDGWHRTYSLAPDGNEETGEFDSDGSVPRISLYLGWEECQFCALDVGNLASVRISTTSIWYLCPVKGGERNGVFPARFIEAIDAVLSRLASDCDAESIEAIKVACEVSVLTYDEAEALFPAGPAVKRSVWHWYDQTTGAFDGSDFFSHYGFDEQPDTVGFGTYGVRHRDGDAYLCLMLDPRGSMFTVESIGNIRSVQGVCKSDGGDRARFLGEKAPKALIVALNAVLDRMSAYKAGELDNLEESLEAIEVEGVSMNVLTDDEAEELDMPEDEQPAYPEANNTVNIGDRDIVLVNHIDEWRDSDGRISLEALFDSFDMWLRDYGDGTLTAYRYSQTFELYASQADGLIDSFSVEFRDNGDVVYQVTVKRLNDNAIEETAEGFRISRDLAWLLLYTIEEWNYRRDTLNDDMRAITNDALGQDLMVEVISFPQNTP